MEWTQQFDSFTPIFLPRCDGMGMHFPGFNLWNGNRSQFMYGMVLRL